MEAMTATATPGLAHSHSRSMNPTTTEHDFRFPRRPLDAPPLGSGKDERRWDNSSNSIINNNNNNIDNTRKYNSSNSKTSPAGDLRADLQQLKLDLTGSYPHSQDEEQSKDALRSVVFPPFQDRLSFSNDGSDQSPEELQRQDPLAAQIWRFYSKTKQMLPNQDRMQNLTWRMMHMNLRKQERSKLQHRQQQQQQRHQQQQQQQEKEQQELHAQARYVGGGIPSSLHQGQCKCSPGPCVSLMGGFVLFNLLHVQMQH
jgi:GATA-binding protein